MGSSGYCFGSGGPSWNGIPMIGGAQPDFSGSTFFVDSNNGSDGNTGLSWVKAWKTLGYAIAQNNINIAAAGMLTRRNTLFIAGTFNQGLIAAFPSQCDVIGQGTSGGLPMATINGIFNPINPGNNGTRFFNIAFFPGSMTANNLISLWANVSGTQFVSCDFNSPGEVANAISSQGSVGLTVSNCNFTGLFTGSYIMVNDGPAGLVSIRDNTMTGSLAAGVVATSGATYTYCDIVNNIIRCVSIGIYDGFNRANITRNNVFVNQPKGTNGNGGIVGLIQRMQDNRLTATDVNNAIVPAEGTL